MMPESPITEWVEADTLDAMARYGGSFVRHLAKLYGLADESNRTILRRSFSHYFVQYDELAQLQRARGVK